MIDMNDTALFPVFSCNDTYRRQAALQMQTEAYWVYERGSMRLCKALVGLLTRDQHLSFEAMLLV